MPSDKITHRLVRPDIRTRACQAIMAAPDGYVSVIRPPSRTLEQNDKMWAMLTDISAAKPLGRIHTREVWKCIMMNACGHEVQFLNGIDGNPFPAGFSSSKMTKAQMSELIEYMYWFGSEHKIVWSEPVAKDETRAA